MEEKLQTNGKTEERKKRKVTPEEIDSIRTMIEQAKKEDNRNIVKEISEKLGIKIPTLYGIIRRKKIDLKGTIEERRVRIIELAQDKEKDYSAKEIADEVGVTPRRVWQILKKEGITLRNIIRKPKAAERRERIVELAQDKEKDYSAKEIADEVGVTPSRVGQILKAEGIILKTRRARIIELTQEKLTLQQKVDAIKLRLGKKTFAEIATILGCEDKDIEEYLISIRLTERTINYLNDKGLSSQRISEITGIPLKLIEEWRMFIEKEKQERTQKSVKRIEIEGSKTPKRSSSAQRSSFLDTIKVKQPNVDANREQRLDDLSKRLVQEELSDEDVEDIKRKVIELKIRPSLLVNRAGRKINLTIEQACLLTSNGERLGIMKQEIIRSIVSTYIQHKNIGKAQRYLEEFSTELDLQTRNELITDIRTAKQGMEH